MARDAKPPTTTRTVPLNDCIRSAQGRRRPPVRRRPQDLCALGRQLALNNALRASAGDQHLKKPYHYIVATRRKFINTIYQVDFENNSPGDHMHPRHVGFSNSRLNVEYGSLAKCHSFLHCRPIVDLRTHLANIVALHVAHGRIKRAEADIEEYR